MDVLLLHFRKAECEDDNKVKIEISALTCKVSAVQEYSAGDGTETIALY